MMFFLGIRVEDAAVVGWGTDGYIYYGRAAAMSQRPGLVLAGTLMALLAAALMV